jgi:uncharacterized membrane protein YhhN
VTPPAWALLTVAAVAGVVDWWAVWAATPRARLIERIAKPAVVLALLGAVAAATFATPAVRSWLFAALAASLVGDVLLLPPARLLGGLAAFLVGHIAFLGAFLQLPTYPWGAAAGSVASFAVIAFIGRDIVRAVPPAALRIAVALYLVAICTMAALATATLLPLAIAGAWLFVASDTQLGRALFVVGDADGAPSRPARLRRLRVMVTYHAAQALLLLALLGV